MISVIYGAVKFEIKIFGVLNELLLIILMKKLLE